MKNKRKDKKEREERPVELKDTVFFAERGIAFLSKNNATTYKLWH